MMQDFVNRFVAARRNVIARRYHRMNERQREAVLATEGPLLLLAGAGSGKTTVLINRVDNLLNFGRGSDCGDVPNGATEEDLLFLEQFPEQPSPEDWRRARRLCAVDPAPPWSVIAITFTNKAAGELKERLERMCGPAAKDIWAATFHRACIRILRRYIDRLGGNFNSSFTIYDSSDSQRVVKDIVKDLGLNEKEFQPRAVLSIISGAKDKNQSPEQFAQEAQSAKDWRMPRVAQIYTGYDRRLREANALDFDDIILHTVHLLQKDEEVRAYYQKKFRYVLIDEYQDTNHLQYLLAKLLAGGRQNICVVGDDDQSIYRFRGANIENILSFEKQYEPCRTIRLEQNYRSTQNILDAANEVIRNNTGRKGKTLWTESGAGDKVQVKIVLSETDEADFVAGKIMESYGKGSSWRDHAVLYRMNSQSNVLEIALKRQGIPYKVYGGLKFFDRAEIKDMLAYLCILDNPADDLRLRRIVNVPARGIGGTSLVKLAQFAEAEGVCIFDVMKRVASYPSLRTAAGKILGFVELIQELRELAASMTLPELYDAVCEKTNYIRALEEKKDLESQSRIENVRELRSSVISFLESGPDDPSLAGFLDSVALYTDMDDDKDSDNCVTLMTMHSAKGLEFPYIYVVGMEEGVFPGSRVIGEGEEVEEERRLCYVAMTRAREHLVMTAARQRMLYGRTNCNPPSRFLEELPKESVDWEGAELPMADSGGGSAEAGFGGSAFDLRTRQPGTGAAGTVSREMYGSQKRRMQRPPRDPGFTHETPVQSSERIHLETGDAIHHQTFGDGMVLSVRPMGNDVMAEIAFQDVGTKKLMLQKAGSRITKLP